MSQERERAPTNGAALADLESSRGQFPRMPLIVIGVMALITIALFSWWIVR